MPQRTPLSVHPNYKLDNGIVFNLMECSPVSLSLSLSLSLSRYIVCTTIATLLCYLFIITFVIHFLTVFCIASVFTPDDSNNPHFACRFVSVSGCCDMSLTAGKVMRVLKIPIILMNFQMYC